ncbi:MAG: M23 family metallopeptidase [Bdellovibrionales bacterium]|nr:M23 family metallopeptidase [Bdellovibrionales bacterium]
MQKLRKDNSLKLFTLILISILLTLICIPSSQFRASVANSFVYPLMSPRISSSYGLRKHPVLKVKKHHSGLDLAAPSGAPIRAISDGVVVFADPFGAYGNFVVIEHGNGLTSHYGHCETISVKQKQKVSAGEIIATVGKTGRVTGPHLHLEIRSHGTPQDPENYIPYLRASAEG